MSYNKRLTIVIGIFILFFGGCYYLIESNVGATCIRMTVDQSVKCECDFNSNDEWQKFKDETSGYKGDGWESVIVEGDGCL